MPPYHRRAQKKPEFSKMRQNPSQNPPQTFPKSFPTPLKSSQNPTQKPPRPLLKTIANTSMKKKAPKTTQEAPRASRSLPKPLPNPPKWSPRRPQIKFLSAFLACFFPIANLHRFLQLFQWNLHVFSRADLQNSCAHAMFRGPPHRLTLFEKITRNHRQIFPKSFPNPPQNFEKSIQNRKKSSKKRKIM